MALNEARSTARWRLATILLAVAAVLCLGAGVALPFVAGRVFDRKLAEMLPISATSVAYSSWVSGELRFQVWMWNLTNAGDVLSNGTVPSLKQVGPFTFKEMRTRLGVQFHANNTVGYDDVRSYYFLPEESVGSMADYSITNVNLPYFGGAMRTRYTSPSTRKLLKNYMKSQGSGIFVSRTVEELLLGFRDPAMHALSRFGSAFGLKLPSRFGILLGKNATAKGSVLVGTGAGDLNDLNRIHLWNGHPRLNLWRQDWANEVVGTDGTMFPPPVTPQAKLLVFTPDLCRSANMTFKHTDTVHGIPVLAFTVAKTALMNASGNPHNAAFCTPRCLDSGVLNLSLCLPGGPPIVASAPHFYGAPTYAGAVSGVEPQAGGREFETRLEIEPNTGLLLRAARRMQINVALESVEGYPDTQGFRDLFLLPYLWLNESGSIAEEPAARFRQRVLRPMRLASLISWLLIALGISLIVVASVVGCLELRLRSKRALDSLRSDGAPKAAEVQPLKQQQQQQQQQHLDAERLLKSLPETVIM